MNREEAKKILPILTAFVEGKQIQWFDHDTNKWIDCTRNGIADYHFFTDNDDYRIKPEPKYRPFKNAEECWGEMQKHQPFGWIKSGNLLTNIISIGAGITIHTGISNCNYSFKSAFSITFADGTPFGMKEE